MRVEFDPRAPIEPGMGMAGVRLRSHISEFYDVINRLSVRGNGSPSAMGEAYLVWPYYVAYNLSIGITMVFNVMSGRLYRISADERYKGSLFGGIRPGMPWVDALRLEKRMSFDDDAELWRIEGVQGVSIDTDGWDSRIEAISVFITELDESSGDLDKKISRLERGEWS